MPPESYTKLFTDPSWAEIMASVWVFFWSGLGTDAHKGDNHNRVVPGELLMKKPDSIAGIWNKFKVAKDYVRGSINSDSSVQFFFLLFCTFYKFDDFIAGKTMYCYDNTFADDNLNNGN